MPNEQITELLDDIDNSLLLNGDDEDCNNNKNKFDSESESEEFEQNKDMLEVHLKISLYHKYYILFYFYFILFAKIFHYSKKSIYLL